MKISNKYILFIISFSFIFNSCLVNKPILKKKEIKNLTGSQVFDSIRDNYGDYKYFYSKFSASFIMNGEKTSIKGTIKIKPDSIIWISLSPGLGVEIARIKATKDSIFL